MKSAGQILIVDDSPSSLEVLSEILAGEGYDVRPADSGELALAAVAVSPPEVIFLDMWMPGMDGAEVCRQLKARAESRDIPVIFLSASRDFEDLLEGLTAGAVDFVTKPFRREELLARLKTHLELSRLRKDLEQRVKERTTELQAANDRLESELETRKQIEEQLTESEHRFRAIADTAPASIWITSREGALSWMSRWGLEFCGRTVEQIASGDVMTIVHPEDLRHTTEAIATAVKERGPFRIEHRVLRSDGEYRWTVASGVPRLVNGKFGGYIGISLDITELKRNQERALASQKLESLGVLTAGIAHHFNNLLSTILAHSDLVLDETSNESAIHENVSTIARVALRASEVVHLLLAYAGHGDPGTPEAIGLSSLIQEMVPLLQVSVFRKTSLRLNVSKDLPPIWANAAQVRQVVLNLVMNASEALEARPGIVTVSALKVHVDEESTESKTLDLSEGDYVLLEVADSGAGMPDEIRARIFDPFFTTKLLGRGMGLASVQGIVRGAGGTISVASSPDQGSSFRIWFPSWKAELDRDGGKSRVRSNLAGTILLVDDKDAPQAAVMNALQREGFSVMLACDGLGAIQLFAKHSRQIEIVVLRLTQPGLSDQDVCMEIRRMKTDVRVLFTRSCDFVQADPPVTQANDHFLREPYEPWELVQTLRKIMAPSDQQSH